MRNEFLSEEDLDLKNMSREDLFTCWNHWLEQAQVTNDADRDTYSHGVFIKEPAADTGLSRVAEERVDYQEDR